MQDEIAMLISWMDYTVFLYQFYHCFITHTFRKYLHKISCGVIFFCKCRNGKNIKISLIYTITNVINLFWTKNLSHWRFLVLEKTSQAALTTTLQIFPLLEIYKCNFVQLTVGQGDMIRKFFMFSLWALNTLWYI